MIFTVNRFMDKTPYPCVLELEDPVDNDLLEEGKHIVYGLVDPRNDTIYYVGATWQFYKRMKSHCIIHPASRTANRIEKRKYEIHLAGKNTKIIILKFAEDAEEAEAWEMRMIKKHGKTILNIKTSRWVKQEIEY